MEPLVFDRKQADVDKVVALSEKLASNTATQKEIDEWNAGLKGAYNHTDLNRIETWVTFLSGVIEKNGFIINTTPRPSKWEYGEIVKVDDINRIRNNINLLKDSFFAIPEWRELTFLPNMSIEQANANEWNLQQCYTWLERLMSAFVKSGSLTAISNACMYIPEVYQ